MSTYQLDALYIIKKEIQETNKLLIELIKIIKGGRKMRDRLIKEIFDGIRKSMAGTEIETVADSLLSNFNIEEKGHISSVCEICREKSVIECDKLTAERDRLREALSWICSESGDERVFNRAVEALSPEPEKVDKENK